MFLLNVQNIRVVLARDLHHGAEKLKEYILMHYSVASVLLTLITFLHVFRKFVARFVL